MRRILSVELRESGISNLHCFEITWKAACIHSLQSFHPAGSSATMWTNALLRLTPFHNLCIKTYTCPSFLHIITSSSENISFVSSQLKQSLYYWRNMKRRETESRSAAFARTEFIALFIVISARAMSNNRTSHVSLRNHVSIGVLIFLRVIFVVRSRQYFLFYLDN